MEVVRRFESKACLLVTSLVHYKWKEFFEIVCKTTNGKPQGTNSRRNFITKFYNNVHTLFLEITTYHGPYLIILKTFWTPSSTKWLTSLNSCYLQMEKLAILQQALRESHKFTKFTISQSCMNGDGNFTKLTFLYRPTGSVKH